MALIAISPILVFALAACGPRITNQNLQVVNDQRIALEKAGKGLSPKEVESILGLPKRMETFKMEVQTRKPVLDGIRYFYEQDGQTIELHFVDGKLISELPTLQPPASHDEKK